MFAKTKISLNPVILTVARFEIKLMCHLFSGIRTIYQRLNALGKLVVKENKISKKHIFVVERLYNKKVYDVHTFHL